MLFSLGYIWVFLKKVQKQLSLLIWCFLPLQRSLRSYPEHNLPWQCEPKHTGIYREKSCKEHRPLHSTQSGLHKLSWSCKAQWFCFKVYCSWQPGLQHHFFSLLCYSEYLLQILLTVLPPQTKAVWFTLAWYFSSSSLPRHMETGNSRSPATSVSSWICPFLKKDLSMNASWLPLLSIVTLQEE